MPAWVTRLTTLAQVGVVICAIAAVVILAVTHVIDGATAIASLLGVTGAGTAGSAAIHVAARASANDIPADKK